MQSLDFSQFKSARSFALKRTWIPYVDYSTNFTASIGPSETLKTIEMYDYSGKNRFLSSIIQSVLSLLER